MFTSTYVQVTLATGEYIDCTLPRELQQQLLFRGSGSSFLLLSLLQQKQSLLLTAKHQSGLSLMLSMCWLMKTHLCLLGKASGKYCLHCVPSVCWNQLFKHAVHVVAACCAMHSTVLSVNPCKSLFVAIHVEERGTALILAALPS